MLGSGVGLFINGRVSTAQVLPSMEVRVGGMGTIGVEEGWVVYHER